MLIYEESPNGPLANQILDGEPVLACNWGFGVENGRPYFDTGMATPGQQAHLVLVAPGRIAIIAAHRPLFGLLGAPLPANPPARGGRVDTMQWPAKPPSFAERARAGTRDRQALPPRPASFAERQRAPTRDQQPLPTSPPTFAERFRPRPVSGMRAPLPANPVGRSKPQSPLPAGAPARGGAAASPLPPNPVGHAKPQAPVPPNAPGQGLAGRTALPANPPARTPPRSPVPPNPPARARRPCSTGCEESAILDGLCQPHYLRRKVRR